MSDSIHAHEVLRILMDAESAMTTEELRTQVEHQFGADASFHTCSMQGMRFDDLVEFLLARDKVNPTGQGLLVRRDRVCSDI